MNRLTTLVLLLCFVCLITLTATAANETLKTSSQMLFFSTGNVNRDEYHFVVRVVQQRNPKDYYYYRVKPITVANLEKGEWIASFLDYSGYSNENHRKMFAWGKLFGSPAKSARKFSVVLGETNQEIQFDKVQETPLARLICASAESGKSLEGIPAYKKWANVTESEMQTWEPLLSHLASRDFRNGRRSGRDVDLYSVFTGISAIRETLQTDANLQTSTSPGQQACHANTRVILGAAEMYNMDHATMMDTLDLDLLVKEKYLSQKPECRSGGKYYGNKLTGKGLIRCPIHGDPENMNPDAANAEVKEKKLVKAAELNGPAAPSHPWRTMIKDKNLTLPEAYQLIPSDCAFIHYPSYTAFRKSFDFFDEWAGALGSMAGGDSANFSLEQRLKDQLLLKTDLMTRLFADLTISDIVLVCEDPFLFEGSAFAVLLKINNATLLNEKLSMTAAQFQKENPSITESQQNLAGTQVQVFSSPDYRFRSYRFAAKGFQILSNSPVLTEKIIATIDGKLPALTEFLDLHYFYEHIEKNFAIPGRIFAFLSDAFIRKLISPAYKIATKRRLDCMKNTLMQTHELLLSAGKLNPAIQCPEVGAYELINGEVCCPNHRSFGKMTPVSERLPDTVTEEEAESYKQFVTSYNQYFRQFFDPIGFAFTTEPSFRGRLLIMPLVDNGIYSDLQKNVRRQAMNPGPKLKNGIVKFGANLKVESLPRPPGWWYMSEKSTLFELMKQWFTGCLWVHIADHPLLFQWDSSMLARSILSNMGGTINNDFTLLTPVVLSFFSPVLFAMELTDENRFQEITEWIQLEIEANLNSAGGFSPQLRLDRMEEKGVEMYVLSMNLFALRKTFYFAIREGFLVISSKKELLFELDKPEDQETETLLGNFNMVFYPGNILLMKSDLIEQRARAQREACLENLKNIAFVSTFCQSEKVTEFYRLLFGAEPLCPAGGTYSYEMPTTCSIHGSAISGSLKPSPGFFDGIKAISIQTFIEPEGLQSEIQMLPE